MFRFIAFLRAINVGGGRTVKMQALRQVFESLGFFRVATFIASGNVVFETTTKKTKTLERKIERALKEALGYEVRTFVRGEAELAEIANHRPFPQSKFDETWQSNIIFLADSLNEKLKQSVDALRTNTDAFEVHGQEIYWRRRRKQNKALFFTVPLEKILGPAFTVRGGEHNKKDRLEVLFIKDLLNVRHHTTRPNQSMKPTAPFRGNFSVLATDPAHGLSLSR
jgi:uncharacterized protein (DUF1697 family)